MFALKMNNKIPGLLTPAPRFCSPRAAGGELGSASPGLSSPRGFAARGGRVSSGPSSSSPCTSYQRLLTGAAAREPLFWRPDGPAAKLCSRCRPLPPSGWPPRCLCPASGTGFLPVMRGGWVLTSPGRKHGSPRSLGRKVTPPRLNEHPLSRARPWRPGGGRAVRCLLPAPRAIPAPA